MSYSTAAEETPVRESEPRLKHQSAYDTVNQNRSASLYDLTTTIHNIEPRYPIQNNTVIVNNTDKQPARLFGTTGAQTSDHNQNVENGSREIEVGHVD